MAAREVLESVLPILDVTRIRLAGFACPGMALWVLARALRHWR